jgi:toxin ParE1/3/4
MDAIENAYAFLSENPEAGSQRYAAKLDRLGLRFWPTRRFPYLIFYIVTETSVDIQRVLHSSRYLARTFRE